jgi:hypothetical protein
MAGSVTMHKNEAPQLNQGSLLLGFYKKQDLDFTSIMLQMANSKEVVMPDTGKVYSMEEDVLAFTLAVNRYLEQAKNADNQIWEIYKFEGKLFDQLAAAV